MEYYQLKIELFLKYEIFYNKTYEPLSKFISSALINSPLKKLHFQKGFKYYVFGNLEKKSEDKIYKVGKNTFTFRTIDKDLAFELSKSLIDFEDEFFKVEDIKISMIKQKPINSLLSLTPVVMSFVKEGKKRNWTIYEDGDIFFLQKALHNNLVKKYETFFKKTLPKSENFIEYFEIKNQVPIAVPYKNGKIFANKFYIKPKADEISQKLAFIALACGLGEKNPLGFGFCKGW